MCIRDRPGHHEEEEAGDAPMGFGQESRASRGIGREGDVLSEFGHVHDPEEAATLFDPQTKEILRAALNEMWQAELHLRQAEPDRALPYEYKALDYIKQVQQAQRIYLQRVGLDLPQLDETRRLSGDRAGLSDRGPPPPGAEEHDSTIATQWSALAGDARPDLVALEGWVRARQESVPDALGVLAAIDALRRDPQCEHSRACNSSRQCSHCGSRRSASIAASTPSASGTDSWRARTQPSSATRSGRASPASADHCVAIVESCSSAPGGGGPRSLRPARSPLNRRVSS